MSDCSKYFPNLPPEQQAIRDKCFHPTGTFVRFEKEEIEQSIPERFEKIVRKYPNCLAVKVGDCSLAYTELNQLANRIAHAILVKRGGGSEAVALLFEQGIELIAAMFGVLKAGKFFLILDPDCPAERNNEILADAESNLVVTNSRNVDIVARLRLASLQWINIDALDAAMSVANLGLTFSPDALGYLIYTSGSTGRPKGVVQNQRNLLHASMSRINAFRISNEDRMTLLSSGSNQAVMNILSALLNGARLCPFNVKQQGTAQLSSWLIREGITIYHSSASVFRQFVSTLTGNEDWSSLRLIRSASETVTKGEVELYRKHFSSRCVFANGLSTTETGTSTLYFIDKDTPVASDTVPVGYPLEDMEVFLLDEDGNRVDSNCVGEIAIRSRYLAHGYWRRPDLTQAKFQPDPEGGNERIYLTGDFGRISPDGCLEHLGRKEFLVKVRGNRVETSEVELKLLNHPGVKEVAVVGRESQPGDTRLLAYVVPADKFRPSVSELRAFLKKNLPDYMIPSAFALLDAMPLTPNGKVDRHALPDLDNSRPNLDCGFVPPRDATESDLAKIWGEVLGIDQVGIHDNFFDLGGDSLAATRIVSRVIDTFRLQIPLQALFDSPTVEKMALVISQKQGLDHEPRELCSQQSSDSVYARAVERITDFTPFQKEEVERSVPERFEKIVCKYPDRIAVRMGSEPVTYSQLNTMANRLAHAIVARRGTQAEAVVILLDPGARLMAAMLAVLKAGKFFVWVDRSSPKGRLANVLEDSHAGLIICERQYGEVRRHSNGTDADVLDIDSITSHVAEDNLSLNISPNSLAAINYTSGSTGEPKGVLRAHRNLLHQVMLFTNAYRVSEYDRLLLTSSGTAHAVVIGFLALLNGAALLPFDVQTLGVNRLVKWILDEKVSICWIGSPLFRNICHALASEEKFPAVRILRLASEATYKSDIELCKQHFSPECILFNGLSNTESGLICLYAVDFKTEIAGHEVPVGYPVEDKEFLLLDDLGKEVGPGEVGEIAVRSSFLSPGYWDRPELTANKFKIDPEGGDQRIYLSGDLGLMLPDGCLIHKGRKDFRAKVRGYSVEPAEIEKVLTGHAGVGQAAVVPRKKQSGETQLVAYYTCTGSFSPTVSELRSFLREHLPDFMIPSTFVMMDAMPLTHSGKVDRRAFPDPNNVRPVLTTAYVASRNEIERKLVAIWEDVLDVRPVGVHDEFFDLGGDSLSATRVISQVIKHFQVEISLQLLFRSPTIADMASLVAERQGKLSRNAKQDHVTGFSPVPVSREGLLPLSYSQQRLWFLDQLEPGGFSYNLFSAYRLKGELNLATLEQCFNKIISRHEVLRTLFKSEEGSPRQVVLPTLAITMPVFDLRRIVSEADRWAEVRRMCKDEAQRPFDLTTGPLLRIMVLQLSNAEYVLLRAMHHIVSDGWSEGILFHELSQLYEALSNGKSSPLAELPLQYSDYAFWQRQRLQGERLESQLSYWKKQLQNIPRLQLLTDRPRPAIQSSRGARQYFVLSEHLSEELRALSRRHGATLFMTLVGAFQTLLHRYSGQTDIVIGSPVAGRIGKEFEKLIGFFLNTLVLRLDLSGRPTFAEVIAREREICLGALSHQELPFEKLVEELHPDRNLSANPLFQVTFAFQNTPRFIPRVSNIAVDQIEVDTGIARFDLHLFMEEEDNKLRGYFDYNSDLFNVDTINRLVGHFQTLLEGIVTDPDCRISDLPILTAVERQQLLVDWNNIERDWNDTGRDYPIDRCVHELFEEQARTTPEATAVVCEGQRLTYREINGRANQLGQYLRKHGVGPEVLVGVCVKRSLEMVVALLGILKAGGAYVPLDPSYPKERLAFILEDSGAAVLLTEERWVSGLAEHKAKVIGLDTERAAIARESDEDFSSGVRADQLAYVIYTSGSTGQPKGVAIAHHSTATLIYWAKEFLSAEELAGVLASTSICFDLSVFEIFVPLSWGGKVILAENALALAALSGADEVTLINTVPSAMGELLKLGGVPASVRRVCLAGERLTTELVGQLYRQQSIQSVVDLYGPSEDTTYSTYAERSSSGPATIGRPIANTQIYLLDQDLNPLPIGVPGELYIGGDGLARGYHNRPDLTAERFMPNPFSNRAGERLYRTGDLARYRPDGNIEFIGRNDNQVKVRGFRVELGEIEAVIRAHSDVSEAVVLAREDSLGEKRLVGYVVINGAVEVSDLRGFLKEKLPDYMVPSAFVFLASLPLTANGKVDRQALPAPDPIRPELETAYIAPRTPTEELLAEVWGELLKLEKVGIHDNFFELGGHSLLATQVTSRIRKTFQIELPLRAIFELPTLAELAQFLETHQWTTARSHVPHPDHVTGRQHGEI